ncbi:MAG TPA: SDR family oxidoreductase [Polyangiales bacterium]|nr:SDR family oxidoreductase [Polyangiales bacterium]
MTDQKVALVTGANTGIGRVTARELARRGFEVFLACRDRGRTEPVLRALRAETGGTLHWLELELGDLASVRRCAREFLATGKPLHLLINNAGVAGQRGKTASGFELAFGINHVGHFLFTLLLTPRLVASAPARIVTVASRAHKRIGGIDFDAVQSPSGLGLREYQVSKLANVLFSAELARKLEGTGVSTYALHPGVIKSDIWRNMPAPLRTLLRLRPMLDVEAGAQTTLYCATAPELANESGLYYSEGARFTPSEVAQDAQLAAELWLRSERWTAQTFSKNASETASLSA